MHPTPDSNALTDGIESASPDAAELAAEIHALRLENQLLKQRLGETSPHAAYEDWFNATFGTAFKTPNTWPFTTFAPGSPWCDKVVFGMQDGEFLFAEDLLRRLDAEGVQGAVVEFGAAGGTWIEVLASILERAREAGGPARELWGFDSFEGLPTPDPERDGNIWAAGQSAMALEDVAIKVRAADRPFLHLVKGWFQDTLAAEPAASIGPIAYARIDGDLYASAVECLAFLAPRLADGAILVFDDWQFSPNHAETLAFREWAARHPEFRFEFLAMNAWAHLYCRVHRRA